MRKPRVTRRPPLRKKGKRNIVRKALYQAKQRSIAKVCKRVIGSMAEKKVSVYSTTREMGPANYTAFGAENIIDINRSVLQPIAPGTDQQSRVGNRIRTAQCWFTGILYPFQNGGGVGAQFIPPSEVKMWVVSSRINPNSSTVADIDSICQSEIFQLGGINQGMQSNLTDMVAYMNNDVVRTYYKRTFKVGTQIGSTNVNNQVNNNYNNDFKLNHKFSVNLTKYIPKNITYNDNTLQPYSKKIFIIFEAVYANGVTPAIASQPFVSLEARISYTYTDI